MQASTPICPGIHSSSIIICRLLHTHTYYTEGTLTHLTQDDTLPHTTTYTTTLHTTFWHGTPNYPTNGLLYYFSYLLYGHDLTTTTRYYFGTHGISSSVASTVFTQHQSHSIHQAHSFKHTHHFHTATTHTSSHTSNSNQHTPLNRHHSIGIIIIQASSSRNQPFAQHQGTPSIQQTCGQHGHSLFLHQNTRSLGHQKLLDTHVFTPGVTWG